MNRGLVLSLVFASVVSAQSVDPFEAKTRALAHPRYAEREKAGRELEEAGEPALKALRSASHSSDPELRRRAETLISRIERASLSQKLLVAPLLHLKLDKVPLQMAISTVATRSGLRFHLEPNKDTNPQRPITLDTGEVPFWQAIQAFYDAAGLIENDAPPVASTPSPEGKRIRGDFNSARILRNGQAENRIRLTSAKGTLPSVVSESMRIRTVSPAYALNKYDPATGEITFHLDVDAAKGVEVREILGIEVRKTLAADRRQLACAFPVPAMQPNLFGDQMWMVQQQIVILNGELLADDGRVGEPFIPVTLKTGGVRPSSLAEFHGVLVARIMAPPEPIVTINDVFEGKTQSKSRDGLSLTVKSSDPGTSNLALLRVQLISTGETINELLNFPVQVRGKLQPFIRINRVGTRAAGAANEFLVRDADGKAVNLVGTRVMASTSDGITMTQDVELKIEKPQGGLKNLSLSLNGRHPAIVEMPFVLRDVPLK